MKIKMIRKELFSRNNSIVIQATIGCLLLLFAGSIFEINAQKENDIFPVPESYQTEGIPPFKKSEVEHLFYDPSEIRSNLIWDADQKNRHLLVTDETNNVYLLDAPMGKPIKLFEKIVPYAVRTSPDGESFVLLSDHEDPDNYKLYQFDIEKKTLKKLVTLKGKDESIESVVWSKEGDSLTYIRIDYDTKTSNLCKNNFFEEKCYQIALKGNWDVLDTYKSKILLKYWKASSSQLLYVYDVITNKLTPVDEKGNSRRAFIADDRIFWTSEGNDNCKNEPCILSFNLKNSRLNQLKLPENLSNLNDVRISPQGRNLLIQETKDGIDYLRVFRLKNGEIVKEFQPFISGSYVIWNTRWLSDNEIVYTVENLGKPASIESFNIQSKQLTGWTKERLPTQLKDKVDPPKIIKWSSFDKKEITGYLVNPKANQEKSPVLIYVHGGPQTLDKPVFNSQDIRLASSLGMTIIHTNIRGSSGFGKEFMDADNKEKRGDAIKDIQALLDWIEKQPGLDPNQIYLRGESYGGFIVLATALQEANRIKGVIAEYPLVSIRSYLSQSWIEESAKNEYGDPTDEALMSKLDELSPLNNTDRWKQIPLLLTRGKLDSRSPEKDLLDMKNQLLEKGSDVWFIFSNNDGHGVNSKYVTAAMYQFLKKQINSGDKK